MCGVAAGYPSSAAMRIVGGYRIAAATTVFLGIALLFRWIGHRRVLATMLAAALARHVLRGLHRVGGGLHRSGASRDDPEPSLPGAPAGADRPLARDDARRSGALRD